MIVSTQYFKSDNKIYWIIMSHIILFFNKYLARTNMKFNSNFKFALLYCISFMQLGLLVAAVGPLIPIKSKELGLLPEDFSSIFIVGGIGALFSSMTCNKLQQYLSWHHIIGICQLFMGVSAILLAITKNILIFSIGYFFIIYSYMIINIIITVAILRLQTDSSDKWYKALFLCNSLCAFLTPFILVKFLTQTLYYYSIFSFILCIIYFLFKPCILFMIFAILDCNLLIIYLVSGMFGLCLSSLYPLALAIPSCFGYTMKTQHTSQHGIANCISMPTGYITGMGIYYFGHKFLIANQLIYAFAILIVGKVLIKYKSAIQQKASMTDLYSRRLKELDVVSKFTTHTNN